MPPEVEPTPKSQTAKTGKAAQLKQKFKSLGKQKKIVVVGVAAVLAILLTVGIVAILTHGDGTRGSYYGSTNSGDGSGVRTGASDSQQEGEKRASQFATDPTERGKYLSLNNCSGTGSKKLGSAPMKSADIGVILPYGLTAGGHVTPVDHQYYFGKNASASPSTYDVLSPGDGTLVSVEVRPRSAGTYDVRGVISYSCTFFSYFDLANTLSADVDAKMPADWKTINGPQAVSIPVKQGQVIAKVGGQSLDFAVWDTTKSLKGLLVPAAYNNYEPWKINTVRPTDYFTDTVKSTVLPFYARTVEPRDGTFDHDIDGTASGNWFKAGTNGYIGAFKESDFNPQVYADGHLSLAPDLYDPSGWIFSTGAVKHGTQYAIKAPSITPDKLTPQSGMVKYELLPVEHVDQTGAKWFAGSVPTSLKLDTTGTATQGTALVQMNAKRELKVEIVLNERPSQVSGFTSAAAIYTRGDEAKSMAR